MERERQRGEGAETRGAGKAQRRDRRVCARVHTCTCLQWEAAQALCPSVCPCPGHRCRPRRWLGPGTSVAVSRRPALAEGHSC